MSHRPPPPSPGLSHSALMEEERLWKPLPGCARVWGGRVLRHWPALPTTAPRMHFRVGAPKGELGTLRGRRVLGRKASWAPLHPCKVIPREHNTARQHPQCPAMGTPAPGAAAAHPRSPFFRCPCKSEGNLRCVLFGHWILFISGIFFGH